MFKRAFSAGLLGVEGCVIQVEADVSDGLPGFHMVGFLASEVKEAEQRVRTAIRNSGFTLPPKKVTVNLSPANVRKEGTGYDFPIAVAVLAANGIVNGEILESSAFVGELGLDGALKPVRGVLSMVVAMGKAGIRRCFLPEENVQEGLAAEVMEIVKVRTLAELVEQIRDPDLIVYEKVQAEQARECMAYPVDFSEVNGQFLMRRATEVAVAGRHNLLYIGPPGSGKSMMASRIPTIMPELSREEQMEISQIYSICGLLPPGRALMGLRPFRSPHHTITAQALTGGGARPRPGEISLASRGVLFLDELPEFQRQTLEILRQPLEEHRVTVARIQGSFDFPAHFMLAAAMNPCPCGYYPDRGRCRCSKMQVRRYADRISKPLLDRIDICVEASPVAFEEIRTKQKNESSEAIRKRVEEARQIQKERFAGSGIYFNAEMGGRQIEQFCELGKAEEQFLEKIYKRLSLSARGCHKILKVARTIADLEKSERILQSHLAEAVSYRETEEIYWGRKSGQEVL
ncbi:YifB family Mg chelatase-like AAA ATPase [Brotaphodocola sp.]|uniref:YifB family Mg chelatase-like AAA ATPase n=1 Tax=Brotaphodocola sp. TaxID=3073577 RepID=UPI003D7D98C2